jgi:hypothetical protein
VQAGKRSGSNGRGDVTGRVEDGDEERCSVSGDYADLGMLYISGRVLEIAYAAAVIVVCSFKYISNSLRLL